MAPAAPRASAGLLLLLLPGWLPSACWAARPPGWGSPAGLRGAPPLPALLSTSFVLKGDAAHNQAMVHWTGENSSVILILTKYYHVDMGKVLESSLWRLRNRKGEGGRVHAIQTVQEEIKAQLLQKMDASQRELKEELHVLILADGDSTGFLYRHLPFLSSLEKKDGKATAYLCENFTCSLPVISSQELRHMLSS